MLKDMPFVQVTKLYKEPRLPAMTVMRSMYEDVQSASHAFFVSAGMSYPKGEKWATVNPPFIDFFEEGAYFEDQLTQLIVELYNEEEVRLASISRAFP